MATPTLGGGPPSLSILSGVAEGLTRARKEDRERRRQAILNRLRNQQVESSEAAVELNKQREERLREQQEAREERFREQVEAQRQESEETRRAEIRSRLKGQLDEAKLIRRRTDQLMRQYDMPMEAARDRAILDIRGPNTLQQPNLEPEEPDEPSVSERRFKLAEAQRTELADLYRNEPVRNAIAEADTPNEAVQIGMEAGFSPGVIGKAWEDLGGGATDEAGNVVPDFELSEDALASIHRSAETEVEKLLTQAMLATGVTEENAPTVALAEVNKMLRKRGIGLAERGETWPPHELALLQKMKNILIAKSHGEEREWEK